jgi:pyruvate formate lyase activating enzyme
VSGKVHSWDLSTGVDGPGTRLVVFLTGCPLRCLYCQNPDTWRQRDGKTMEAEEIGSLIRRYRPFVSLSGGGFTVSGGEPLQQPGFTAELLWEARRAGLHTAVDTSGHLGVRTPDALLELTDLVLLDIKAGSDETHRRLTGGDLGPTLVFAERLAARGIPVWVRYVVVPGFTDAADEVDLVCDHIARLPNVQRVDVLPFHKLGAPKYEAMHRPFPLADMTPVSPVVAERVRAQFRERGLVVS